MQRDATPLHYPRAYPGFFVTLLDHFNELSDCLTWLDKLFRRGTSGKRRSDDQDHSVVLCAWALKRA